MKRLICIVIASLAILGCGSGDGDTGWTTWRGPGRNGIVSMDNFNPAFPENGEAEQWRIETGYGYSSLAVTDKYIYTMGQEYRDKKDMEVVYCLDRKSGKTIWDYAIKPSQIFEYAGPKAMPILDEGRLYVQSSDGKLTCLDSRKGTEIWQKKLTGQGAGVPYYGFTGTPVVCKDRLIVNAGYAGMALDKYTGEVVWKTAQGKGGYASPVLFDYQDRTFIALFGSSYFHIVDPENGEILSSLRWSNTGEVNASDPVYLGDGKFFVSSSYDKGSALVDFSTGELKTVLEFGTLEAHFSCLILKDGLIYGISGNNLETFRCRLVCFDPLTGEEKWSQNTNYYGSVLLVNDTIVLLLENGALITVKADPSGYEEIAKTKIFEGRRSAWIAPVAWDGILYLKSNTGELAAVKMN